MRTSASHSEPPERAGRRTRIRRESTSPPSTPSLSRLAAEGLCRRPRSMESCTNSSSTSGYSRSAVAPRAAPCSPGIENSTSRPVRNPQRSTVHATRLDLRDPRLRLLRADAVLELASADGPRRMHDPRRAQPRTPPRQELRQVPPIHTFLCRWWPHGPTATSRRRVSWCSSARPTNSASGSSTRLTTNSPAPLAYQRYDVLVYADAASLRGDVAG